MVGRALKEIVPVLVQSLVLLAAVLPFGFELHVGGAMLGLALAAFFAIGIGALSYALALAVAKNDWVFWLVQQTMMFPLLLLAGVLLPLETGPGWLRALSTVNPLRYLVDAERALFGGEVWNGAVAGGVVAAVVTVAAGVLVGTRSMQRA
jgi:ABC-2 type transport system permease protein